jgi:sarcosine oxidase/sarcosine oxidase/L-pipecolate oxidase
MACPEYNVIVVGGGPIGLAAAYYCAKEGKKVLVLEQFTFGNALGSSAGYSRQFRICYAEDNLCGLAIKASKEWDKLMLELNDFTLMERTGTLWFGESDPEGGSSSGEGGIKAAIKNLNKHDYQGFTHIKDYKTLNEKFPFVAKAAENILKPEALYVPDGGTINVLGLAQRLQEAINKYKSCKLLHNLPVTSIDHSSPKEIKVITEDGQVFTTEKVILTPGTYVNYALSALKPAYNKLINMQIFLWASTYFKIARSEHQNPTTWPTWHFFGESKVPTDHNLYYGYPVEHPTSSSVRVSPAFETDERHFYYHLYPPDIKDRPLDRNALKFTSEFVSKFMKDLDPAPQEDSESTCLAGFAVRTREVRAADNSGGIVLDFIPGAVANRRISLCTGGWCMKYVPVMGKILSQMALEGAASMEYAADIQPMNIGRGILIDRKELGTVVEPAHKKISAKSQKFTSPPHIAFHEVFTQFGP